MQYDGRPIPHDPHFQGPLKNRSCTDIPCLIIFVIFIACWIAVGIYALKCGDVETFVAPTDSLGRKCGIDSEVANKSYLFFFNLAKCDITKNRCTTPQVCVDHCPSSNFNPLDPSVSLADVRKNIICKPGVDTETKNINDFKALINIEACAPYTLKSSQIVKRCLPVDFTVDFLENSLLDKLKDSKQMMEYLVYAQGAVDTVASTYGTVLLIISGGAVVCIIYMFLLKWLALPCVCLAIFGVCALFSYLAFMSYQSYDETDSSFWLTMTIILGSIAGIVLFLSLCLWQRIYLACQLIKEASKAVMSVLSSLFFPIFPWLIHLGILTYFLYIGFSLVSIGEQKFKIEKSPNSTPEKCICLSKLNYTLGNECDPQIFNAFCLENAEPCLSLGCHLTSVDSPSFMTWIYIVHIIGGLWAYFFISALGEMTLAATFATWYWTLHKRDVPFFTVSVSLWRTVRYHLGTVAFGALLITICRFFRLLLEYIHTQSMQQEQLLGNCGQAMLRCSKCLMDYLERFLKFMNRNAYIVCAVYGKGLCASAADALSLLMRNIVRVVVLNKIVDWLLFAGKLLVTTGMIAFTWWYYKSYEQDEEYWWVPTVLVGLGSYLVASVFFSVHETAVDTIFLCFLEDCERHDGSDARPYYMTRKIAKILNLK